MKSLQTRLRPLWQTWQRLAPRTQQLLVVGMVLLAAALFWALVWQPTSRQRTGALQRLPFLQQQLQVMRTQALEVQRVRNLPPTANAAINRNPADSSALQALFGSGATVSQSPTGWQVQIQVIAYSTFLDQLDQALARFRLRVDRLSLQATADNRVSVNLGLVDPEARVSPAAEKAAP